jgi:hypothetical protein
VRHQLLPGGKGLVQIAPLYWLTPGGTGLLKKSMWMGEVQGPFSLGETSKERPPLMVTAMVQVLVRV